MMLVRYMGLCVFVWPTWWRHQMETFSALLAICAGNSPVPGEFPTQRPVTRSFDVYFDLCPNKWLSKQSLGWWLETLSPPLWRHRNDFGSGDWKDISIGLVIIIIKSDVSTIPIVIIISVAVCLRCLLHHILSRIAYTSREKPGFHFLYHCAVYDECK